MSGWVVRNNTFENDVFIAPNSGTNGTRWVGNIGSWSCKSGITFRYNVGDKCSATDKAVSPAALVVDDRGADGLGEPRRARLPPQAELAGDQRRRPGRRARPRRDGRPAYGGAGGGGLRVLILGDPERRPALVRRATLSWSERQTSMPTAVQDLIEPAEALADDAGRRGTAGRARAGASAGAPR